MSAFPILLRSRLCDESHIRMAKAMIDDQVDRLEVEHRTRKDGQTAVDFLLAVANRPRAATVEMNEVAGRLSSFSTTKKMIDDIVTQLSSEIEELAECYVFETSEAYARGARAFHHLEEWTAGVEKFEALLTAYLKELGEARPLAGANYNHAEKRVSAGADAAINRAIEAAIPLQQHVHRMNELADAHEANVRGTPAAAAVFPRIPIGDYAQWTRRISEMPIREIPLEFDRLIGLCETLSKFAVPQLRTARDAVPAGGRKANKAYLQSYLATLREFSYRNWYDSRESDCRIAELERRYARQPQTEGPAPIPQLSAVASAA